MRVALITGGGSGMGRAVAVALAKAGLKVAAVDISPENLRWTEADGSGVRGYELDVSDEEQVSRVFAQVERELGPIAVLANFAGISGANADGGRDALADISLSQWHKVLGINLDGTFLCSRELMRLRRAAPVEAGRIINVTSVAAQNGGVNGSPAYVASKGGVMALTKSVANEAAALGFTVNCIAPGTIDTPMLRAVMPPERDADYLRSAPIKRVGSVEEIAAAVTFLASEAASYITGVCLDVNGGLRMQ